MGTQSSLVEHLRSQGIRITTQRVAIAQAIDTLQGHFTAEEVYAAVQHVNPQVNPATVYRTLELLVGMGLATESHLGSGSILFALRDHGDHHHAVCRGCGQSVEFDPNLLDAFVQEMRAHYGFAPEARHMVVFGWCARCRTGRVRPRCSPALHAAD